MSKDETYFKLFRSLLNHQIWLAEPFTKGQAWVDLIGMANWGTTETIYKGQLQKVERGQIQTSLGYLAKRWDWSVGKVRRYLELLNGMGMAHSNGTSNGMTITLENYAFFQGERHTNGIGNGISGGIPNGTQKKNNKNNNIKETCIIDACCENPDGEIVMDSNGYCYFVPAKKEEQNALR